MRDIYRNPALYYVFVPIAVALWPLLVRTVYLPNAEDKWLREKVQYLKAQEIMEEILTLDRDRLANADSKATAAEFDYSVTVDKIARLYNISYTVNSKPIKTSSTGQKTKNAVVILKDVDITTFAKFFSTIQFRWADLQCIRFSLRKKKGLPDKWDVTMEFKYYY